MLGKGKDKVMNCFVSCFFLKTMKYEFMCKNIETDDETLFVLEIK